MQAGCLVDSFNWFSSLAKTRVTSISWRIDAASSLNRFGSFSHRTGRLYFAVLHLSCKVVLYAPVWIWKNSVAALLWFCRSGGLTFTSRRLNINLPDKVFQRWALFGGSESSLHLRATTFFFFSLNPCLTPHRGAVRLTSKDQGLQRSFAQMKMMHDFLLSVFLPQTHTPSPVFLSLYFIKSVQPCTNISLSSIWQLSKLLRRRFSSIGEDKNRQIKRRKYWGRCFLFFFFPSVCYGVMVGGGGGYRHHSGALPLQSSVITEAAEHLGGGEEASGSVYISRIPTLSDVCIWIHSPIWLQICVNFNNT